MTAGNHFEEGALQVRDGNHADRQPGQTLRDEYISSLSPQSRLRQSEPAAGTLELPPAFPPAKPERTAVRDSPARADLAASRSPLPSGKWTLVFDLTTTQSHSASDNSNDQIIDGAEHKRQELLKLAEMTKGTGVSMLVEAPQPQQAEHSSGSVEFGAAGGQLRGSGAKSMTTYLIHDGRIEELGSHPSKGAEADLERLVHTAATLAPAERMALFAQAHGGGPHGLSGDTGSIALDHIAPALSRGLQGTGRSRLDLVDFDACSMGNTEVVRAMADITSQVVASPEKEHSGGAHNDAQNLPAIVRSIAANPQMDGGAAGAEIVRLAGNGANGGEAAANAEDREHPGTPTLSHYDLNNLAFYSNSVNTLGGVLAGAARNPESRQALMQLIDETPLSSSPGASLIGKPQAEERDLRSFAEGLIDAARKGIISDPDGSIGKAAQEVLNSLGSLVQSYHGEHEGGYDRQGGISIFLPGQAELDSKRLVEAVSPLKDLVNLQSERPGEKGGSKESILERIDYALKQIKKESPAEFASCWQALEQARRGMNDKMTGADFGAALDRFRSLARQAELSAGGRRLNEKYGQEARRSVDDMIANQHLAAGSGWEQLITALRGN